MQAGAWRPMKWAPRMAASSDLDLGNIEDEYFKIPKLSAFSAGGAVLVSFASRKMVSNAIHLEPQIAFGILGAAGLIAPSVFTMSKKVSQVSYGAGAGFLLSSLLMFPEVVKIIS